jgi:hypothetical protein
MTRRRAPSHINTVGRGDSFAPQHLLMRAWMPAAAGSTTCAATVSLLVRDALPADASSGFPEDPIANISLVGTERYFFVHEMDDILGTFGNLAFNSSSIVPGRALIIGGSISGNTLTPAHVMPARQGFSGTAASSINNGTFTFNPQGLAGALLPSPASLQCHDVARASRPCPNTGRMAVPQTLRCIPSWDAAH